MEEPNMEPELQGDLSTEEVKPEEEGMEEPNGVEAPVEPEPEPEISNNKRKYEDEVGDDDDAQLKKRVNSSSEVAAPAEEPSNGVSGEAPAEPEAFDPATAQPVPVAETFASAPMSAPTGEVSETIDIPSAMVGKLIGKQGETIRQVQMSTQTKVQIDHSSQGEFKKVTVIGRSADALEAAKLQIRQIVSEDSAGESQHSVDCPHGIVGRIIGRGGETIRALQQASQAHIVVNQDFPEGEPRKINVSGKPDAVERAVKMISELIQGEPGSAQAIIQKYGAGVSKVVDCPKAVVGRVIGKGGETIKALQKTYGANIQIDQSTDPMKITVAGQAMSVENAANAVVEIINGGNPYLQGVGFGGPRGPAGFGGGGGGGFAPPQYGGFGGGYGGAPQFPPYGGNFGGYGGFPQAGYGQAAAYGGYGGGGYAQDPYAAAAQFGGGASGYGGGGAAVAAGGGGGGLWQELQDGEGRNYYYNTQTGSSQWEKPADFGA